MANTLALAAIYQQNLDKAIAVGIKSGFLEANPNNIIYNGGSTIKIASIEMDDLKKYDRSAGFGADGTVTLSWEDKTLALDLGQSFSVDAQDVDETAQTATITNVLNEFQRTKVVPAVDKYRFTKLAQEAGVTGQVIDPTKPDLAAQAFINDIATMLEIVDSPNQLRIITSPTFFATIANSAIVRELKTSYTVNRGELDTTIVAVNDVEVVQVPSSYLNDKVVTTSGVPVYTGAKKIPYVILKTDAPTGIVKADVVRLFAPNENQSADAWKVQVRLYHDLFVPKNQKKGILAASFTATP